MYDNIKGEELQKILDADLAETKRICAEIIQNLNACKNTLNSIDTKIDRLSQKLREETKK